VYYISERHLQKYEAGKMTSEKQNLGFYVRSWG